MALKKTRPDSWKTLPLPSVRRDLRYERRFSRAEVELLALGLLPRQMEEKWFVVLDGEWLLFYRSWTGTCMFGVRIACEGESCRVAQCWINAQQNHYRSDFDALELRALDGVITWMLSDDRRRIEDESSV